MKFVECDCLTINEGPTATQALVLRRATCQSSDIAETPSLISGTSEIKLERSQDIDQGIGRGCLSPYVPGPDSADTSPRSEFSVNNSVVSYMTSQGIPPNEKMVAPGPPALQLNRLPEFSTSEKKMTDFVYDLGERTSDDMERDNSTVVFPDESESENPEEELSDESDSEKSDIENLQHQQSFGPQLRSNGCAYKEKVSARRSGLNYTRK